MLAMATAVDEAAHLLTELARAAAAGNNVKQALARCVAAGASIDEQVATDGREITSSRMPPLLHAAKAGNIGAVKALLAAGAAVTATGASGGATALHVAFECTNKQRVPHVVRVLIDAGASVTARRSNGFTPLHAAAQYDCADGVRLLLAAGANLEARCTQHGAAALAHAAAGATDGKAAALCALLEAGADPTSVDKHGMSALVTAACSNPQEADVASGVVGVLVAAGADVNEERAGRTALDVCLAATRLNRLTNLMPHMYQPAPPQPLHGGSVAAGWLCHSGSCRSVALPQRAGTA
jgi:ankyrin repeat protein